MKLVLSADKPSHIIGHYGARLVCALMCSGLIALSILARENQFQINSTNFDPQIVPIADYGYFEIGCDDVKARKECNKTSSDTDQEQTAGSDDSPIQIKDETGCEKFKSRDKNDNNDASIILVGKADCLENKSEDTNMILARDRAEDARAYLEKE